MPIDVLAEAARVGAAAEPAALVTVIRTGGSTPRHPGAKMLVHPEGTITGTIGGGRIEHEVTEAALAFLRAGTTTPARLEKHLVQDLAMCCGGRMEVLIEPLDEGRWKAMGEAARRRGRRQSCALITSLRGGGKDVVVEDPSLAVRRPRLDLEADRFVEPILPADRLVLFGGGHVARALAPFAAQVGFELTVCDDDPRFATEERFPGARLLHSFDVKDVAVELAPFGAGDHVIILTRDHAVDQKVLEQLLPRRELTYLGLIGSRGKLERFRRRLEAKQIGAAEDWARLRSPVGLDIGAETPEEIAVAIVAELVKTRRRGEPQA